MTWAVMRQLGRLLAYQKSCSPTRRPVVRLWTDSVFPLVWAVRCRKHGFLVTGGPSIRKVTLGDAWGVLDYFSEQRIGGMSLRTSFPTYQKLPLDVHFSGPGLAAPAWDLWACAYQPEPVYRRLAVLLEFVWKETTDMDGSYVVTVFGPERWNSVRRDSPACPFLVDALEEDSDTLEMPDTAAVVEFFRQDIRHVSTVTLGSVPDNVDVPLHMFRVAFRAPGFENPWEEE